MPDRRQHRGSHPEDARLFDADALPALRAACSHLAWLASRGYATNSSLKLVGDRFDLTRRQRTAVMRAACSDAACRQRRTTCIEPAEVSGAALKIDGYNLITTIEAALGGGVLLACRDGTLRDMCSMHGTYRKVAETEPAVLLIGRELSRLCAASCRWYLDSPVSNSGRLKTLLLATAAAQGWPWEVELVADPDPVLCRSTAVVVTADSQILDACSAWLNLAAMVVGESVPDAWIVDLGDEAANGGLTDDDFDNSC